MKYTAIYVDTWMSGSHMHSLTKMRRVEQKGTESVLDMLKREGIKNSTTFLFIGHPRLQGEDTYKCPACGDDLAVEYSLHCPHGKCESIAANDGAIDKDPEVAYNTLRAAVVNEQQRAEEGPQD